MRTHTNRVRGRGPIRGCQLTVVVSGTKRTNDKNSASVHEIEGVIKGVTKGVNKGVTSAPKWGGLETQIHNLAVSSPRGRERTKARGINVT